MGKAKPDDRSNNAAKIKRAMSNTKNQMEAAKEMMGTTGDPGTKANLEAKNKRRSQALHGMESEMK